jgi:hypothetical protein
VQSPVSTISVHPVEVYVYGFSVPVDGKTVCRPVRLQKAERSAGISQYGVRTRQSTARAAVLVAARLSQVKVGRSVDKVEPSGRMQYGPQVCGQGMPVNISSVQDRYPAAVGGGVVYVMLNRAMSEERHCVQLLGVQHTLG